MFRFTIRDVLWLMVVVALVRCWTVEQASQAIFHPASSLHEQ